MKKRCILCNQRFQPTQQQQRKLWKHPHKIQICSDCHDRITQKVQQNKVERPSESH